MIKAYPIIRSIASYIFPSSIFNRPGSGGTYSSEYCYSVWLRHLHYLLENKLFNELDEIKKIAEIGPGDSLGIGIAALYTGADEYHAFDVIKHAQNDKNLTISNELAAYYSTNKDIPNTERQRNTYPLLPNYSYPDFLKGKKQSYFENKKEMIAKALINEVSATMVIKYQVPWLGKSKHNLNKVDLIFSQAVMEHVDDIETAYQEMFDYLRKGGVISHQIDFKTHEMTKEWNGHWFINPIIWKFLLKGRKYSMNRLPLSAHLNAMIKAGFDIKFILPVKQENSFGSNIPKFSKIKFTDDDMVTSGALIQAIKPL